MFYNYGKKSGFYYGILLDFEERRNDSLVQTVMTEEDWKLVSEINNWVSRKSPTNRMVVIWVRRSCSALESDRDNFISVGYFEYFCDKVLARMDSEGLPHTLQSVEQVLAQESDPFRFRLVPPLQLEDIEKIEDVGNQT